MNDFTSVPLGDGARAITPSKGFLQRLSGLLQRANLAGAFGTAFGGARDYYEVFGYDRKITAEKMWEMYHRGGIAHRIIHAYPDAVWSRPPDLYLEGSNDKDPVWAKFVKEHNLWSILKKADVLAGIGRYAVIIVGTSGGAPTTPVRRGAKITYLQPFSELNVQIQEWEADPTNPRFGLPKFYSVYPNRNRNTIDQGPTGSFAPVGSSFRVHHSRVWHVARGALESPVYGIPRYAPIWNYLSDLTKIVGSSAESYWMTAYQGLHIDVDAEIDMNEEDAQDLSDEIDEYQHGLRRAIRTRGTTVKTLGSKVADPRGAFEVVLTLISGATGIPKRILMGSEAGHLASSQDKGNWAERVEEERADHAEPNVIRPLINWLNEYGILSKTLPIEQVQLLWPDAYRMSPLERGQTAAQTARTATNLVKALEPIVVQKGTPGSPAKMGPDGEELAPEVAPTPDVTTDALLSREEARAIIGLSTDQSVLDEEGTPVETEIPEPVAPEE